MAFELPALPYPFDALDPHIDAQTMEIHHDRHHATYVNNLNGAIGKHPELGEKSIEELLGDLNSVPEDVRTVVRNNGGGHLNHSIFWTIMGPDGGGEPSVQAGLEVGCRRVRTEVDEEDGGGQVVPGDRRDLAGALEDDEPLARHVHVGELRPVLHVHDRDRCAFTREEQGGLAADAAAGPRNQYNLVG